MSIIIPARRVVHGYSELRNLPQVEYTSGYNRDLLAYWWFKRVETSGTPIYPEIPDLSLYSNNAVVNGNPSTSTLVVDDSGMPIKKFYSLPMSAGGAPYYDADINNWPSLDGITVDFIGYLESPGPNPGASLFISNTISGTNLLNCHFPWHDGNIYFDLGDATSGGRISVAVNAAWINKYGHWTFTSVPGTGMAIYFNGQSVATLGTTSTFNPSGLTLRIGRYDGSPQKYHEGEITYLRMFKKGYTPGQVRKLYEMAWQNQAYYTNRPYVLTEAVSADQTWNIPTAAMTMSAHAPTFSITVPNQTFNVPTAAMTMTAHAPTVSGFTTPADAWTLQTDTSGTWTLQ